MHFPVNIKLSLHFSPIHKNGFIAFWNQTLHILSDPHNMVLSLLRMYTSNKIQPSLSLTICILEIYIEDKVKNDKMFAFQFMDCKGI
jgi:hypothetical protein